MEEGLGMVVFPLRPGEGRSWAPSQVELFPLRGASTTTQPSSIEEEGLES